jgi:hypothetical protein
MNLADVFSFLIDHIEFLFLAVVVPLGAIGGLGWSIINQLDNLTIEPVAGPEAQEIEAYGREAVGADWLAKHGFIWDGAYRSQMTNVYATIALWKQRNSYTHISVIVAEGENVTSKIVIDITSTFGLGYSLTTAGNNEGPMFPVFPGIYQQQFNTWDIERLWQLHTEMEAVVAPSDLRQLKPIENDQTIELITAEIKQQIAYIRSLRFWPFRVLWWYFVNRPRHHNKTVIQRMSREQRRELGID